MDDALIGDWSADACRTVAAQLTAAHDLGTHRDAVVETMVAMHLAAYAQGERCAHLHGRAFSRSPQQLLAQIHSFGAILSAQREALEDQQRFRLVGLDRLADTVTEVEALQASLGSKRQRLEQMNAEANERLQRMVHNQQAAESQREASLALRASLQEQEADVAHQRDAVLQQLAEAEPAVLEAQAAVSNIKKPHLTEVRSMANPPAAVKSTMESVCILLGHHIDGWKSVQGILRRDDFIASVVRLDTEQALSRSTCERLRRDYLSRDEYNYDTIQHASKACGPLALWVMAQVHYAEILERVAPLRAQVASVESRASETKENAAAAAAAVAQLEESIAAYKAEYATLISEIQAMKSEMERVGQRVERSVRLLAGLEAEKARWETGRAEFDAHVQTLVGDVLLCSALIAYAGYFDQAMRETLWEEWQRMLRDGGIPHRPALSVRDMLVSADTQAAWIAHGLPSDALAMDNAVIMEHCTRYPLLIDPTGDAGTYLERRFRDEKLASASCLDAGFVKVLESALRFGTPLLLTDAEHLDPVLLPVLKQERRRTGGRVLVRVAQQDVDCAPTFRLFLTTRDANIALPPHLFCRVQMVNFTTTRKSLQSQALQRILHAERPDVEAQRTDVARAQGEFQRRLQHLERALLAALNDAQGNLLESDTIVATLETLKGEAEEVQAKAAGIEQVASHVQHVTQVYEPLAEAASAVYFVLQDMQVLQPYYQWDLGFFWALFDQVLAKAHGDAPDARLAQLHETLFQDVYRATAPSLLHEDHLVLAARLCQVKSDDTELEVLLQPALGDAPCVRRIDLDRTQHKEAWDAYSALPAPEADAAPLDEGAVRRAIAVRIVRPDRAVPAISRGLQEILGAPLLEEDAPSLASLATGTHAHTPLLLCSMPGHDASGRVEALAAAERVSCAEVALGAPEATAAADRALATAARTGQWVLVKNAHLALAWLAQLVPRLTALHPHASTRVFVTCELSTRLPPAALRHAHVLIHEPPAGVKSALVACLRMLAQRTQPAGPQERTRLYFLVSYLHAVAVERRRYVPLGWTSTYEFHDADFLAALDVVDTWTAHAAGTKAHLDPAHLPWDAVRTLLKEYVYGAKLDHAPDRAMLDALVDRLFVPAAFDDGFVLAPDDSVPLAAPDGTRVEQFVAWAQALMEPQPVEWLLLAPAAERSVAAARAQSALGRLAALHQDQRETAEAPLAEFPAAAARAAEWLGVLPVDVGHGRPEDEGLGLYVALLTQLLAPRAVARCGSLAHCPHAAPSRLRRGRRWKAHERGRSMRPVHCPGPHPGGVADVRDAARHGPRCVDRGPSCAPGTGWHTPSPCRAAPSLFRVGVPHGDAPGGGACDADESRAAAARGAARAAQRTWRLSDPRCVSFLTQTSCWTEPCTSLWALT